MILATHNKNKYLEIANIMSSYPIQVISLENYSEIKEIIEDGSSLKENALIKAKAVNNLTKLSVMADDTGLEVDFLNGRPGIFSARFAGEQCSYSDNVKKLLHVMKNVPLEKRTARFRTVVACIVENMELISEGVVEGIIMEKPKGFGGFGYDPVFYVPEKRKTYSEMKLEQKNMISHRKMAVDNMLKLLQSRLPYIFHKTEDLA